MIWWSIYKKCCLYLSISIIYIYIAIYIYTMNFMHKWTNLTNIHPPSFKGATWSWRKNCWNCSLESWGIRLTSPKMKQAERLWIGLNGGEEYWNIWQKKYIHIYINGSKRMVCISYLYNYDIIIMILLYCMSRHISWLSSNGLCSGR